MHEVRLEPYPPARLDSVLRRAQAWWRDGTLLIGLGVLLVGAVLPEAIRFVLRVEGRVAIFPWLLVIGLVSLLAGAGQRRWAQRRNRAGVTVAARDPDGPPEGPGKAEQAELYSQRTNSLTFAVRADLTGEAATDLRIAEQVVHRTSEAIRLANRFQPDAAWVSLIPMMRLHLAFWVGARLGRSHNPPLGLLAPVGGSDGRYFLAMVLSPASSPWWVRRSALPFRVTVERITQRSRPRCALAVSLRERGAADDEQLRAECRAASIDQVIWLRSQSDWLPPQTRVHRAALDQVEREWRERLPADAVGPYPVFLDTTVSLAVGIGARLGGTSPARWIAYTFNWSRDGHVRFPPDEVGTE